MDGQQHVTASTEAGKALAHAAALYTHPTLLSFLKAAQYWSNLQGLPGGLPS